jgi:hypothetical protein
VILREAVNRGLRVLKMELREVIDRTDQSTSG